MEAEYIVPADLEEILGINPQDIRNQAHEAPELLGFPVIVTGTRIRIPRRGFIHYMKYGRSIIAEVK